LTYAISDEIHQTFVPTRTGSLTDVFIDSVGIFLAKYYTETYIENLKKYI
jgi:VanZ family protein